MESHQSERPSPEEARRALAAAGDAARDAQGSALYGRGYAAGVALWSGAMGVAVGFGSGWLLPIFFGGLFAAHRANLRRGARVREVSTPREAAIVLTAGLVVGVAFLVGREAVEERGSVWVPWAIGAAVSATLFLWMELAHRGTRRAASVDNGLHSGNSA